MKRRDFITLLGGAAAAWPLSARAQQQALPVIGYLDAGSPDRFPANKKAFHQGLGDAGFVEGRSVLIEYRNADGQYERLPALASELVRRQVAVIASVGSNQSALAAKAATTTIPIIFSTATDPVSIGLVASLNRPGGNLTGASNLSGELVPKKLELLHEIAPAATTIAILLNPHSRVAGHWPGDLQPAADALGIKLKAVLAGSEGEFETAFSSLAQLQPVALLIPPDALFLDTRDRLGALSLQYAVPAIYTYREFAAAGGLLSYGGSQTDTYRTVGFYTGRVLKGEKPTDLPVWQSTKVQLVINLKTAKALGITVPITLLGRADEVIEEAK